MGTSSGGLKLILENDGNEVPRCFPLWPSGRRPDCGVVGIAASSSLATMAGDVN